METVNLDEILNESLKMMEEDFYKQKFYFSYSSLSKLLWSPVAFHQIYIMGMRPEKQEAHLVQGQIVHNLLLEPEKFNERFIISPDNLPTGTVRTVIDRVFSHHLELSQHGDKRVELTEFNDAILDVMRDMNYYQSLKTDQQRLDKIVNSENISYWNFLVTKGNKTLISQEDYNYCSSAVDLIKNDSNLCKLLGCNLTEFDNREVFNEKPLQCEANKNFGLKGIVDNLVIDHDEKILYINDVKTTSKDLKDFPETIEFYSYWMQAVLYCTLVSINYRQLLDVGYQIKFHFVVIDRNFQTYAFPVREQTLQDWLERLSLSLNKAEWHYKNRNYTLPYDFATGSVVL